MERTEICTGGMTVYKEWREWMLDGNEWIYIQGMNNVGQWPFGRYLK